MILINVSDLDSEHPPGIKALLGFAGKCVQGAKFAEAERLYEKALAGAKLKPSERNLFVGAALNNLGVLRAKRGKRAEALRLMQRAMAFWLQSLESAYPHIAAALNNLACICMESGNVPEAEALYSRSLWVGRKPVGAEKFPVDVVLQNLQDLQQSK